MAGAASGLIEATKNAPGSGAGWASVPHGPGCWFTYGGGGIGGFGSLCGVPNGCCAFLNLAGEYSGGLGEKVLGYYSETSFPTSAMCDAWQGDGPEPIPDEDVLAHTVALSPLCHISISKWCDAAGVSLKDPGPLATTYKQDRCGKVCADMAAFTAELINGSAYTYTIPEDTALCRGCHGGGGPNSAQNGKMDCAHCHTGQATIIGSQHANGQHNPN